MSDGAGAVVDLSKRVHSVIAQYVYRKTEARCGITWEAFKDRKVEDPTTRRVRIDVPQAYREAREKVCQDAFVAMRACRAREDFVAYFTGTICAVPQ